MSTNSMHSGKPGTETAPYLYKIQESVVAATLTGLVCFLIYAYGISAESVDSVSAEMPRIADALSSSSGDPEPGVLLPLEAAPRGDPSRFVERVSRLQLEDVLEFITGDGIGTITREVAILIIPIGSAAYRLGLAAAFLGALTVSLLVMVMLRLGLGRVAAVASALAFACSYPAWQGATMPDSSMVRAPMLVLVFWLLVSGKDHRSLRMRWVAALALWVLCTVAEPMLLCLAPGVLMFMYFVALDRMPSGHVPVLMAVGSVLTLSLLLAVSGVGVRTWPAAADAVRLDAFAGEAGLLGLAFLMAAAFSLWGRPTREELLVSLSCFGAMTWMFFAEAADGRQLKTLLVLTCPVVGYGMSAVLRCRTNRAHVAGARVLAVVLPATTLMANVDGIETLRDDRAHLWTQARDLAEALPENAAVVTVAQMHEPIADLWRVAGANGRHVVRAPLDVRRVLELEAQSPIVVFEPTRAHLELLGFRFRNVRIPNSLRGQRAAYLTRWQSCTAVWTESWVNVEEAVANGGVGVGFGAHARDTVLAMYIAASGGPLTIDQDTSSGLQSRVKLEVFDRDDPGDGAILNRLLLADGVASHHLGRNRFVHRVHVGRDSDRLRVAAIRIDGRWTDAIARVVEPNDAREVLVCPASS